MVLASPLRGQDPAYAAARARRWSACFHNGCLPRPASAPTPWDWFHINAVYLDADGNLLINSRFIRTTYKSEPAHQEDHLGAGGKLSTFKLTAAFGRVLDSAAEVFAYQQDPEAIGNGEYRRLISRPRWPPW